MAVPLTRTTTQRGEPGFSSNLCSARQKTHFFREAVLPRLVISGLIINTGAIFSCRRIKNDNNFYLWRL
ncbi:MAG: hypothetical protein KZQ66_20330 [Candidatus Thiodiazotropha sp. (ex Lucinoma aequizonata)]|nr:hypothetical protein [Candidatus Thiodiazotropha sp. (ex Lucinoma aequizonata)]MCU7904036.1 hypothetical protein [Candidatus Thiodiazotropha sp. (ex Lucinoma aequizonata)]